MNDFRLKPEKMVYGIHVCMRRKNGTLFLILYWSSVVGVFTSLTVQKENVYFKYESSFWFDDVFQQLIENCYFMLS